MSTSQLSAARSGVRSWRDLAVFIAVAYGGAWLVWSPKLAGLQVPGGALTGGSMVCVALATFLAVRRTEGWPTATGLKPFRLDRYSLLALLLLPTLGLLALALGALTGVYPADLADFSYLRALRAPQTLGEHGVPAGLLTSMLATSAVLFVVSLPLMLCEEWGWRGYLLPRLLKLGTWPALGLTGLLWGLWHLPGYAAGDMPLPLPVFLVFTLLLGVIFGWLRLASGSVWPCAIAHGTNNVIVAAFNAMFADDQLPRTEVFHIGLSGWPGWMLMLAAIAVLFATRDVSQPRTAARRR